MLGKMKTLLPILLLIVFGLIQYFGGFAVLDDVIYDNLLASERAPMDKIVVVGIDERSISEIGLWPWPRYFVADTIQRVAESGAAVIGANILYDAHGISAEHDAALVNVASGTDRLVLGAQAFGELADNGRFYAEDYVLPFYELAEVVHVGFLNAEPDSDGVMRRALTSVHYGDITIHSLPYEIYRTYCRVMGIHENEIPLDRAGTFPIRYVSKPGGFTTISLWDVINGFHDPGLFEDAIVLIGPYAHGIGARDFTTPLEKSTSTFGVEINANIIQNMLEGDFKQNAPEWLNLSALSVLGLLAIVLLRKTKPVGGAAVTVALIVVQIAVTWLAYTNGNIVMNAGAGIVFLIFCFVTIIVLSILTVQNEKQHIQGLFGRFVAPEVVNEIMSGNVEVQLGGSEKEITVLFVDIRGFTAFSEANPPDKVVSMVNRYLALTSRSIQENGGTIDKYIGDATMGIYNAPSNLPDHALRAVRSAWAMKVGAEALQEEIMENYGVDLQFGIGVNTGLAVVGNMGSDFRMDYTAIGDTVNTAARLEGNAEKGQILISDATYQFVKDHVEVTDLGVITVKNKKTGVQIYSLENIVD